MKNIIGMGEIFMRKCKKTVCILIIFSTVLVVITGCKGNNKPTYKAIAQNMYITTSNCGIQSDGKYRYPNTPIEFTMMWMYDWWVPLSPLKWGEDTISQYIQKNFNVKINQIGSDGDPQDKLNLLIASKNLPDVIVMDRNTNWRKAVKAGVILPIDNYVKKYPAYPGKVSAEAMNAYRLDGKLYGLLNWSSSKNHPMGNGGYAINEKLYKEMGSPPLNTLDDLYNYLMAVKARNITVDNKSIIPFQGDTRCDSPLDKFIFRSAFGGFNPELNPHYLSNVNGKLVYFLKDSKWVDTLLYINKLYKNGLINQDAFTEKTDQLEEKLSNGRVGVFSSGAGMTDPVAKGRMAWKTTDPQGDYRCIEPFTANNVPVSDVWTSSYDTLGWNIICITKNAKDPERIYAYFDWVISNEGQLITFNGPQGIIWDRLDEDGYPIFTKSRYELPKEEQDKIGFENYTAPGFADFIDFAKVAGDNRLPPEKRDWVIQAQSKVTWVHSINGTEYSDISPDLLSPEGIIEPIIKSMTDTQYIKIIMAGTEDQARALIDETIKKANATAFEKLEKFKNDRWQQNLKRINGK